MAGNTKNSNLAKTLTTYQVPIDGPATSYSHTHKTIISEEEQQFLAKVASLTLVLAKDPQKDRPCIPASTWVLSGLLTSPSSYGTKVRYYAPVGGESKSYEEMIATYAEKPWKGGGAIYVQLLNPYSRGLINVVQIPNTIISGVMVTGELIFKTAAAALTRPVYALGQFSKNSPSLLVKIAAGAAAVVVGGPLWLVGQVAFIPGNLLNYGRKVIDGTFNALTSAMAWAKDRISGSKDYGTTFPKISSSLKTIGKSIAMLFTGGIPAVRAAFDPVVKRCMPAAPQRPTNTEYSRNNSSRHSFHSRRKSSKAHRSMVSADELEPSQTMEPMELKNINSNSDDNSHGRQESKDSQISFDPQDSFKRRMVSIIEEQSNPPEAEYKAIAQQSRESSQNSDNESSLLTSNNHISSLMTIFENRSSNAKMSLRLSNGSTNGGSIASDLPLLNNNLTRRHSDSFLFNKKAPTNEAPIAAADARPKGRRLSL